MFNLKFEEKIKDIAVDKATDHIEDSLPLDLDTIIEDPTLDSDSNMYSSISEYEDALKKVTDYGVAASAKAIKKAKKSKGKPFYLLQSVILIFFTCLVATLTQVSEALADDDKINKREWVDISIVIVTALSAIYTRTTEGSSGVYTPNWAPGLNEEDFIDEDGDGIDDRIQN